MIWLLMAIAWIAGFSVWFYRLGLPNNPPISRPDFWLIVPDELLDLIRLPEAGERSSWANVWARRDIFVSAALIVWAAWGLGLVVLAAVRPRLADCCAERTVFAFGCGVTLLTLVTLGCGLAGWLTRPVLGTLVGCGIVGGTAVRLRAWGREIAACRHDREQPKVRAGGHGRMLLLACVAAVAPFLLAMLLGATLPPTDFDAKAYHLVGPKEWFLDGRITFLPHNVYTSFPFLTEMLTLAGMVLRDDWFRGALVGQAVLMSFAPFTAIAIYAAGRRWFSPAAGWLAAMVYLTTPWTYRISTIAYAEGGLSFFLFVALLAVIVVFEQRTAGESPWRMSLIAGLLAGSAMACKYTGLVQVIVPLGTATLVGVWRSRHIGRAEFHSVRASGSAESGRSETPSYTSLAANPGATSPPRGSALSMAFIFSVGIALAVGPWLLKNAVQTGNPVYPLAYSIFGGRDWDAQLDARFRTGHSSHADQFTAAHFADGLFDVAGRNDWHNGLLFALAPLALLAPRNRTLVLGCWLYVAFLFLAWWLLTHRIDRFWVPMIPVVALLAGVGATSSRHVAWRIVCGGTLAAGTLFNLAFISTALAGNNAWLGDVDHLRRQAERTAPTIALLNDLYDTRRLPRDAKVLLVGDAQVFDARFPHVYNTVFDHSIFEQWFGERDADAPDGWRLVDEATIRRRLAAAGITHIAVNWQELLRYRTTYGYTDFVTPDRFATLIEQAVLGLPTTRVSDTLYEALPDHLRDHLDTWAPELRTETRDGPRYVTAQIFPVVRNADLQRDAP